MAEKGPSLVHGEEFAAWLGRFYQFWSYAEMATSLAIGELLRITDEEAHLLTARMEFSRKAGLIRELLKRRKHPNESAIRSALNKIQNESKRNILAHSILLSDDTALTFIERGWQQDYVSEVHQFTMEEFVKHVHRFALATGDLGRALGLSAERSGKFAAAALKAQSKPRKSPKPPNDKT